ncbi:MAG: hypothetical protein PHH26_04940 [Candidatus Thermoplasmatota archaeon]|nr:hypothetical protein [Candidatus Thermoplasmatota archaeon]
MSVPILTNDIDMREQLKRLVIDSIKEVKEPYFKIKATYEPSGIVRERVFCYELYHQMRKMQEREPTLASITLNGELDKRGYLNFNKRDRKNPDFVFHKQGDMEHNTAVIEVKGDISKSSQMIKDLNTITTFIHKYQYKFGFYICYNYRLNNIKTMLNEDVLRKIKFKQEFDKINVICIKEAGGPINSQILDELLNGTLQPQQRANENE